MDRPARRSGSWLLLGLGLGLAMLLAAVWAGRQPSSPAPAGEPGGLTDLDLSAFEATMLEAERAAAGPSLREPAHRETRLTSASAPAARIPEDGAWHSFPVTEFSFVHALLVAPARLRVQWLFRNRELNPGDLYLDPSVRGGLNEAFEAHSAVLLRLSAEITRTAGEEFEMLIDAHALQPVHYDEYTRGLDERARTEHDERVAQAAAEVRREGAFEGRSPERIEQDVHAIQVLDPVLAHGYRPYLTRRIGREHYACRLSDLPSTFTLVRAYRPAYLAAVEDLTRRTEEAGALAGEQQKALVKAAATAADRKYPR